MTEPNTEALARIIKDRVEQNKNADPYADFREATADAASAESVWMEVMELAGREVHAVQWVRVANAMTHDLAPHEALAAIVEQGIATALSGPQDTFSGRSNDLRRVKHDALCKWVEAQRGLLRAYGVNP